MITVDYSHGYAGNAGNCRTVITIDLLGEPDDGSITGDPECVVAGCCEQRRQRAAGTNRSVYCARHERAVQRNGFPETRMEHARYALSEAAHAFGDGADEATREALVEAAAGFGVEVFAKRPEYADLRRYAVSVARHHVHTPEGVVLQSAAWDMTSCAAEESQEEFDKRVGVLEGAAISFFRSLKSVALVREAA
jgi:hypothetical protein